MMGESRVKAIRMEVPTPRPPSPYKPGKVSLRARKSVLPALFEFKLDGPRRRDKKRLLAIDAERRMEQKYIQSIPIGCNSKLSAGGRPAAIEDKPAAEAVEVDAAGQPKEREFSSVDVVMREYFLMEAQQEQLIGEEQSGRNLITSEEEYGYTTILVDFLQFLPQVIAVDSPELAEEAKKDELARAQEREIFFNQIADRISALFREEKIKEKLLAYSNELLPKHAAALEELKKKEQEEWEELMEWNRKRLERYGAAMKKKVDYRLRSLKKRKLVGGKPVEYTGEKYLRRLRESQKQNEGQLVVYDDEYTAAHERLFAEVGRKEFTIEKEIRAELDRMERALDVLIEKEVEAREEEQRAESVEWIPVLLYGVDGYYEARRATREREEMEQLERRKEAGDELARAEIKRRLLAKNFSEQQREDATVTPWTPDVVA